MKRINIIISLILASLLLVSSALAGLQDSWTVNFATTRQNDRAMAYNPATGHLLAGNMTDTAVYIYDTTGTFVKSLNMSGFTYTGGFMPYDLDVTNDGVIYILHYSGATVYRWDNEDAAPTIACGVGAVNMRGMKVVGSGLNTIIYTTFLGNSTRAFLPVSASNYTTFQSYEISGDSTAGSWVIMASGDTSNAVLYQITPVGTQMQFGRFVKTSGVWARDSAYMAPYKRYGYKGDLCPTNNDLYIFQYYATGGYTADPGATTRRDRAIIRIDGNTGVQKEVYEVATTFPQVYVNNMGDLAFDTTNHILYWMNSINAATATVASLQLGALKYTDEPGCMKVYEIPAITVDGNTSDWPSYVLSTSAAWSCYPHNTTNRGAADYSGSFKVAWNHQENRMYILAEIADDVTVSLDTWASAWNGEDLVEVYFNPTNYYSGTNAQKVTQITIKANGMQRAAGFGTVATFQNYPYIGAVIAINSTAVAGKRFYEMSVPMYNSYDTTGNGTVHTIIPNEFVGFEADVVDQDGAPNTSLDYKWMAITPGTGKYSAPERIGTVWIKGVITSPDYNHILNPGATEQFTQSYGKAPITWNSSNPAAGTISTTGLFTAASIGVTSITATDADGVKSVPVVITVTATDAPLVNDIKE